MASGPITSWEMDGETVEKVSDFILGGSKITADGDCNHEIKRHFLLGRKVMTNCQEPAHEIPPMTRSWGEDLTSKADQDSRDFKKAVPALTLKMISVFLMLAIPDCSLISVTQAEGLPRSLSKQIQLKTLINMSPGLWHPIRLSWMRRIFQTKPLLLAFEFAWQMCLCPWY